MHVSNRSLNALLVAILAAAFALVYVCGWTVEQDSIQSFLSTLLVTLLMMLVTVYAQARNLVDWRIEKPKLHGSSRAGRLWKVRPGCLPHALDSSSPPSRHCFVTGAPFSIMTVKEQCWTVMQLILASRVRSPLVQSFSCQRGHSGKQSTCTHECCPNEVHPLPPSEHLSNLLLTSPELLCLGPFLCFGTHS